MLALQVGDHGGVIDRLKRLPCAVTAFHLGQLADAGHELVRAGRGIPRLARLLTDEACRVDVWTTAEELTEQLHLVGRGTRSKPRKRLGSQGQRSRIKCREFVPKCGDSGLRRDALRFDPLKVRLCLCELGDQRVTRRERQNIRKLFFAGRFHSVGANGDSKRNFAASSTVLPDAWIAA